MEFQLRKAKESDWGFIWDLRVRTMKWMINQTYGWDEEIQRTYATESLKGEIVLVEDKPLGVLTLSDWEGQLHLTWMAVSPSIQRRGLGRSLVNIVSGLLKS